MIGGAELRSDTDPVALEVRVRGRVQGVGFRPKVWRIARDLALRGEALDDSDGAPVRVGGETVAVDDIPARLEREGHRSNLATSDCA